MRSKPLPLTLAQFKADECLNFFAHAGYGLDNENLF
jgi:hypothetical protein